MSDAILWGILWLVAAIFGTWAIYFVSALIGVALTALFDKLWVAPISIAVGVILALSWFVFAAYNTVMQIISIVSIASGSPA